MAEDFDADGTEMKTIPETATGNASRAHPKKYYTLGEGQSVSMNFDAKYDGQAKLIAYLGSTDSSANKKINESISVMYDGYDVEIDELTFADVGFGSGDNRTYYSAVVLGTVDVIKGSTDIEITGVANNLNIGAVAVIAPEKVSADDPDPIPEPGSSSEPDAPVNPAPAKKGCGGSIIAASSLLGVMAVAGVTFFFIKRKEK